jgi:hypothetical protein
MKMPCWFVASALCLLSNFAVAQVNGLQDAWVDLDHNNQVDKFEAQRCTVFLKNQEVLALGLIIDRPTDYNSNAFYLIQTDGLEKFGIINNRIRLCSIKEPLEFAKEEMANPSLEIVLIRFFAYNWPEVNAWQLEQTKKPDRTVVETFGEITINNQSYQLRLKFEILTEINKIVQLDTYSTKN